MKVRLKTELETRGGVLTRQHYLVSDDIVIALSIHEFNKLLSDMLTAAAKR